jgi:hypothetical protein
MVMMMNTVGNYIQRKDQKNSVERGRRIVSSPQQDLGSDLGDEEKIIVVGVRC